MNNNENNLNNQTNNNTVSTNTIPVASTQEKFVMSTPQIVSSNTIQMPQVNQVPNQTPIVNQQTPNTNPDPKIVVDQNVKKVEINNYTPPSKFKVFLLILFFILLIVFIIYLPEINTMIKNYREGGTNYQKEEITTGKLICSLETNTTNLNKSYEFTFTFVDSELLREKFITSTRGDSTADDADLDTLANSCKRLQEDTKDLDGVEIGCDYSEGIVTERQSIDLETVEIEKLDAAFTEAGGIMPGYQYKQDISSIEKNMKAAGYSCKREK